MWKGFSHKLYLYVFIALVCIPCFYYLNSFLDYNLDPTIAYYVKRLPGEFCSYYAGHLLFLCVSRNR